MIKSDEKSRSRKKKRRKRNISESVKALYEGQEKKILILLKMKYFQENQHNEENWKKLTSEQMLQRLPIALAQVKAGNTSKKLLNEIKKITYLLYQTNKNH